MSSEFGESSHGVSLVKFVIPGLTRNPVSFWIPAGVYPVLVD